MREREFYRIARREMAFVIDGVPELHPMVTCLRDARIYAETATPLLIEGSTGTGKELLARILHNASPRREKNFVALSCPDVSGVDSRMLHSDLFGHAKGAFTDAHKERVGRIGIAEGGTLFIDELDKAPQELQYRLLRVLQEREYTRLGDDSPKKCNVRFLFASAADLRRLTESGAFSRDLYSRICGNRLVLPDLADRRHDLIPMVVWILCREGAIRRGIRSLSVNALDYIHWYDWPRNVRQLEQTISRAIDFATDSDCPDTIKLGDLLRGDAWDEVSPREYARLVGVRLKPEGDNDCFGSLGCEDEGLFFKDEWTQRQIMYGHPHVAKYLNQKTYPRLSECVDYEQEYFDEASLKSLSRKIKKRDWALTRRMYYEPGRVRHLQTRSSKGVRYQFKPSFVWPSNLIFDSRPQENWLSKRESNCYKSSDKNRKPMNTDLWQDGKRKTIFFVEGDLRYVVDLERLIRDVMPVAFPDNGDELLQIAGYSQREAANIMGMSPSAVYKRSSRKSRMRSHEPDLTSRNPDTPASKADIKQELTTAK